MSGTGRPKEPIEEKVDLQEVERLAGLGLTQEEIGYVLGVTGRTIRTYKQNEQFSSALKKGKVKADLNVTRSLYRRACEGDVTAAIFWLKNRQPDRWNGSKPENNDVLERLIEAQTKSAEAIANQSK